jgi:lipopolysaccharide export system permease protein
LLRIQRAFLGELLLVFALVGAITTGVVFAGFTLAIVAEAEGLATQFLPGLIVNLLPMALAYSIPFSWLAATCIVVGRMQAEQEVTALKVAGLHLKALVLPAAAVGLLLGIFGMAFDAYVVPQAQRRLRSGLRERLHVFLNALKGVDRGIVLGSGRLSFGSYDPSDGSFRDVEIDRRGPEGTLEQKVIARRVWIQRVEVGEEDPEEVEFRFEDAFLVNLRSVGSMDVRWQGPPSKIQLAHLERLGASTLFNEALQLGRELSRPKDMTFPELLYAVERGDLARAEPHVSREWMHRALSLGASPFALGLFALAVALALPASGRRVRDFIVAFLPAVLLFFPLFLLGQTLARSGVPTWLGMWSPNLLLLLLSGVLLAVAFRR